MTARPAAVRPDAWARACPRCGLIGVVSKASAHDIAKGETKVPPWPARVGWWCPCGKWVELTPGR